MVLYGKRVKIPWVGVRNAVGRGSDIPLEGVQYAMRGGQYSIAVLLDSLFIKMRGFDIPWVRESKCHGYGFNAYHGEKGSIIHNSFT